MTSGGLAESPGDTGVSEPISKMRSGECVIYVRQAWTGPDGQHHQALEFDMFRVQDGKIAEHWDAD